MDLDSLFNELSLKTKRPPVIAPFSTPRPVVIGQQREAQPVLGTIQGRQPQGLPGSEGGSTKAPLPELPNAPKQIQTSDQIKPPELASLQARYNVPGYEQKQAATEPYERQMGLIEQSRHEADRDADLRFQYKQLERMSTAHMQQASISSPVTFGGTELPANVQSQANTIGAQALKIATQAIGTPYAWGGSRLAGANSAVDCSGLIQAAYKQLGVDLPRVSYEQAKAGKIVGLANAQPGDIVVMDSVRSGGLVRNGHVALYVGNGMLLEAPRTGKDVGYYSIGKRKVNAVVRPY